MSPATRPSRLLASLALGALLGLGSGACGDDGSPGKKEPGGRLEQPLAVLPDAFAATDSYTSAGSGKRPVIDPDPVDLRGAGQVRYLSARTAVPPGGGRAKEAEYEEFIEALLPLIDGFWRKNVRELSSKARYEPPGALIAYEGANGPPCAGKTPKLDAGNAFYCPTLSPPDDCQMVSRNGYWCVDRDRIAWDEDGLTFPLYRDVGDLAAALVLAHEWGHLVQARAAEPFYGEDPPVGSELQADCLAGVWAREMARQGRLVRASLENAIEGVFQLKAAGGTRWVEPRTHGTAYQRRRSYLLGFKAGIPGCKSKRFEPFLKKVGVRRS